MITVKDVEAIIWKEFGTDEDVPKVAQKIMDLVEQERADKAREVAKLFAARSTLLGKVLK